MFKFNKKSEDTALDKAICDALENLSPYDDDYTKKVKAITMLHQLKQNEKPERVSPDTMALILGNLVGIGIIVTHERLHVITSKSVSFLRKLI